MKHYNQTHARVRKTRGKASEHQCQHCEHQAAEWAYDHTEPDELVSAKGHTYSGDPARYIPLCRSCHRKFDGIAPKTRHLTKPKRECSEIGCASYAFARSWCRSHYNHWYNHDRKKEIA
jgi:hypothetical protein